MKNKIDEKVVISYFLPYGITSRSAALLALPPSAVAYTEYEADISMESRIEIVNKTRLRNLKKIDELVKGNYITEIDRKYGSGKIQVLHLARLTESGFYLLTGTPDAELERSRRMQAKLNRAPSDRSLKEICYLPEDEDTLFAAQFLFDHADPESNAPWEEEHAKLIFSEAVYNGELMLLANSIRLAKDVSIASKNMNGMQTFRAWEISNVIALFRANGFLTYLDRRQMETGWAIAGLQTNEDYEKHLADGRLDVPVFVFHALRKWYADNPDSYSFLRPDYSLRSNYDSWYNAPAFYANYEIPGFSSMFFEEELPKRTAQQSTIRHSFIGVAVGAETNYLVYHTQPKKNVWHGRIERTALVAVQHALDDYAKQKPFLGAGREIKNAIVICPTIQQFTALFSDGRTDMEHWQLATQKSGYPFHNVCICTLTSAGVMQMSVLMKNDPIVFDNGIRVSMKEKNSEFMDTNDWVYALSYHDKPVLLAHSMNYRRLNLAYEDYKAGKEFYIACYPEQVTYLKRIMPDAEYL